MLMNSFSVRLLTCLLVVGVAACQSNKALIDPIGGTTPPAGEGQFTERGIPIGNPVQQTIGPAGGSITLPASVTSTDKLTVTVPAGALSSATTIQVQLVDNKALGGIGPAIELSPKDTKLAKPVVITWQYSPDALNGTAAEAIGLARQLDNGTWAGKASLTHDADQHTLTATAPTWDLKHPLSFYANYFLRYPISTMPVNTEMILTVLYQPNHSDKEETANREFLLTNLLPFEQVSADNLNNWRLNGEDAASEAVRERLGTLSPTGRGGTAIYIAPEHVPPVNPVAVTVNLKTGGRSQVMLKADLTVQNAGDMHVLGRKYDNPDVTASTDEAKDYLFVTVTDPTNKDFPAIISAQIESGHFHGTGKYTIRQDVDTDVSIGGKDGGKDGKVYSYIYHDPANTNDFLYGNGTVTITEYNGHYVAGTISATLYWQGYPASNIKSGTFSATFRSAIR